MSLATIGLLAGCSTRQPDRKSVLRDALSTTLRVSRTANAQLLVRTLDGFELDVLVKEASGEGFVLSMDNLEAKTNTLVPRKSITFSARRPDEEPYQQVGIYTEPFADRTPASAAQMPTATVGIDRDDGIVVAEVLTAEQTTFIRIEYPDARPDDILLWPGHTVTATAVPDGQVRVYAGYEAYEVELPRESIPRTEGLVE